MGDRPDVRNKVYELFESVGLDTTRLKAFPYDVQDRLTDALKPDLTCCRKLSSKTARTVALHLACWNGDAAFIVALLLWPEKFTREEIADGVLAILIHAPDHLAAAAKLYGTPVTDVYEVGALDGDEDEIEDEDDE